MPILQLQIQNPGLLSPNSNALNAAGALYTVNQAISFLVQQALSTFPGGNSQGQLLLPFQPQLPSSPLSNVFQTILHGNILPPRPVSGNSVRNPDNSAFGIPTLLFDVGKAIEPGARGPLMTHLHNEFNSALGFQPGDREWLDPSQATHGWKSVAAVKKFQEMWNALPQNQDPSRQLRTDGHIDGATIIAVVEFNNQRQNRPPLITLWKMMM